MASSPWRLVASVVVTCAVAAGGLAATYAVTEPRIVAQQRQAEQAALRQVIPGAAQFDPIDETLLAEAQKHVKAGELTGAFEAHDSSGGFAGWCLMVAARGYSGPVRMVIGLDRNGKVTGLTILSMSETPGLGTRIESEDWFLKQFVTLPEGFGERDVRRLDSISGATRSSRAVKDCVIAAIQAYQGVLKEAGEASR